MNISRFQNSRSMQSDVFTDTEYNLEIGGGNMLLGSGNLFWELLKRLLG